MIVLIQFANAVLFFFIFYCCEQAAENPSLGTSNHRLTFDSPLLKGG
jgi:hypothetical protein